MNKNIFFHLNIAALLVLLTLHPVQAASNIRIQEQTAPEAESFIHVPGDANKDLQTAINEVPNNGTIVIAAGTYVSPNPSYKYNNQSRSFIIQAAEGAQVILTGQNNHRIFEVINSPQAHIVFKGITFANGYDSSSAHGAGVTIRNSNVTFLDCIFQNNKQVGYRYNMSAASVYLDSGSTVNFFNNIFRNNSSEDGGSGIATRESTINVHNSQFLDNTTTSTTYLGVPVGGGINIVNSKARITNSRFSGNNTFGHGAGIYIIGEWFTNGSDVIVANSYFENNHIVRNIPVFEPISGGAINVEDNAQLKVYHSRFMNNSAWVGGGLNIFRAKVEIHDSVFFGNRATDPEPSSGFGGAIAFNFYDRPDASSLLIEDTFIQGKYAGVTTVAQYGGGIHAHGNSTANKPPLTLRRVILNDLDTTTVAKKFTLGAGIEMGDVNFTMEDSVIMNCDARGPMGGRGGAMIAYGNTNVNINRSAIANNSADTFGAGLEIWGSAINIANSKFFNNVLSPGVTEYVSNSFGAGIFTSVDGGRGLSISGTVANNLFQNNEGLPIFDDDRMTGPYNAVVYKNNKFFETTYGDKIYHNTLASPQSANGLNSLVVVRSGSSTRKSPTADNQALTSPQTINTLFMAPSKLLPVLSAGENGQSTTAYLAYGWNGASANLDGTSLSSQSNVQSTLTTGQHNLNVDGTTSSVQLPMGPSPDFNVSILRENPSSTLNWYLTDGSFLGVYANQGLAMPSQPSGSVGVSIANRIYTFYLVTKEGGALKIIDTRSATLYAPDRITVLFSLDEPVRETNIPIRNTGGWTIDWTAQTSTPDVIQINSSSGTITSEGAIPIRVLPNQAGTFFGSLDINGGAAGSAQVSVEIILVDSLSNIYLPTVLR